MLFGECNELIRGLHEDCKRNMLQPFAFTQ